MIESQQKAIIQAKQSRSLVTQNKLLDALYRCLQHKVFEQINIKEIADEAGVSVGTFYRRFKDKESLLPILYHAFGADLTQWLGVLESRQYTDLHATLSDITRQTLLFLQQNKSVFRTLHINARLQSDLLDERTLANRKEVYKRLAVILLRHKDQMNVSDPAESSQLVIFMLVNTLLEKVVYPKLTPAIASDLDADATADHIIRMFYAYLKDSV